MEESQLLIAAIPKLAAGRNTWKEIMSTVAWSLDILFSGTCPKKDKDGQALEKERGKGKGQKGDHWKYKAAQQAQDERMREQQQAAAERAAPKSVAPKSAAEKPAAKPMPSRRVEWLIHNSTAVVEEVPEDENRLVLHEPRRSRQYQSYMAAEAAQKRMRKG